MSERSSEHEWAVVRLAAFASGLMPDEAHDRFEAHAASCDACQTLLSQLRVEHQENGHHISRRVLLDWKNQLGGMKGLQRRLVLQHLESCDECQAVLEHLGVDPQSGPRPVEVDRPIWVRREFWMGTGFGGLAAAAAALVLTFNPIRRDYVRSEVGSEPEVVVQTPSLGTLTSVPEPARLGTDRSGSQGRTVVHPTADRRAASIFVQPTDLMPGQRVALSILWGDSVVVETMLESVDFGEDRRLLWRSPSSITPGRYSLVLATSARAETLAFEVSAD